MTTAEAAELVRYAQKTLQKKIAAGIFREGVHFVQRPGCQKRWIRRALIAWLEGSDTVTALDVVPLTGESMGRGRSCA